MTEHVPPCALTVVPMEDRDACAVLRRYQEGIDTGQATFQALAAN